MTGADIARIIEALALLVTSIFSGIAALNARQSSKQSLIAAAKAEQARQQAILARTGIANHEEQSKERATEILKVAKELPIVIEKETN